MKPKHVKNYLCFLCLAVVDDLRFSLTVRDVISNFSISWNEPEWTANGFTVSFCEENISEYHIKIIDFVKQSLSLTFSFPVNTWSP